MWVLAVAAMKCGILQEELEHDTFELIDAVDEKDANSKEKSRLYKRYRFDKTNSVLVVECIKILFNPCEEKHPLFPL